MGTPALEQINVVLADVEAAVDFLRALGVEIDDTMPEWRPHHRSIPTHGTAFDADLDSSEFASWWGGLSVGFVGVVLNLRVDTRDEVDATYAEALRVGGTGRHEPWDAFWGARYAVVEGPGPMLVGLMSPADDARRTRPPHPPEFSGAVDETSP